MNELLLVALVLGVVGIVGLLALASACHKDNAAINQQALPDMGRLPRYHGKPSRGDAQDWALEDIN